MPQKLSKDDQTRARGALVWPGRVSMRSRMGFRDPFRDPNRM